MTETQELEAPIAETSPAEEETPKKRHQYSTYVHVGPGAAECEHATDGGCGDPEHFHAWCRLPNQFERKSIREKAEAGEARVLRALQDPESDQRVILDQELALIVARGDREALIDEMLREHFLQDHLRAVGEIDEEDEDGVWKTIDEDRERLRALEAKAPEDRSESEYEELKARLDEHTKLVNDRRDAIQLPRRQAVEQKSIEELAQIIRESRIQQKGEERRREDYLKWELYICTFKPKSPDKPGFPSERVYSSIDQFTSAAPEELEAVTEAVTDLEREAADYLKGS